MKFGTLIISMEENAEDRIHEIMKKAHEDAKEIKRTAEAKAETIKKSYFENAEKSVEIERNKLIYDAKAETKMHIIKAKDEVIQRAFIEAKKSLNNFREHSNYKESFKKMIQEALQELEGEKVRLHVDKRDENLCKQILAEMNKNSEVEADLTCAGGLNASTKDEKVIIFNTIESRSDTATELLKFEIFSTLYGD
jgi:vacuolar-type H+-ATPase subunit E/Vma4